MDYQNKYRSKSKSRSSKYFQTEKLEYQSPRYERYNNYQNPSVATYSQLKDLEKSSYSPISNKYKPYEENNFPQRVKYPSILRNTTNTKPFGDYNRKVDFKKEYDRTYERKNVTINNDLMGSTHNQKRFASPSYASSKQYQNNTLNSYLSHQNFQTLKSDSSSTTSPFKRETNNKEWVNKRTDFLERSNIRDHQNQQNQKSRKKLIQRYHELISSKSANQLQNSQYLQKSTYQAPNYKKDYKALNSQQQSSTSIYQKQSSKSNVPKSLKDLKDVSSMEEHHEQKQYHNRVQEVRGVNDKFQKSKNQLERVKSLQSSRIDLSKSKISSFVTLNSSSSKSYADLSRFEQSSKHFSSKQIKPSSFGQKYPVSIHDFSLGKTKGEGKFGTVYAAIHKLTGTIYALKKIPKETIRSHLMEGQLTLEIKLQLFFNHPNILKLYGFFDDRQSIYLILQYMEEGTLFQSLRKRSERMAQKQVVKRVTEMSQAVRYLHGLDVAHRDIKPENIVISHGVSKLCDFGWATRCTDRRKTYCGTFDYAAPEILQGKQYDQCVDLWCLGVLTFQLIVGKVPFYHISRKQTMKKILRVDRDQIVFPNDISWKAKDFIQGLIKKNPEQRTTSDKLLQHPFLKSEKDFKV